MIRGLSGSLLSHDALMTFAGRERRGSNEGNAAVRRVRNWHQATRSTLGPTAGARTVFDMVAAPLFAQLGHALVPVAGRGAQVHGLLTVGGRAVAAVLACAWDADLATAWRDAVHQGIAHDVRWCFCLNGPALRAVDARRSYSRRHAEFALDAALDDAVAARVLCALIDSEAFDASSGRCSLDEAVRLSERTRACVRASLQAGVHDALTHLLSAFARASRHRRVDVTGTFDESLTVVYRILFLLFAEARGLVPRWHPTYRDSYTIEFLRDAVEHDPRARGVWEALQAIARMAHRGCHAGTLWVPPFNGRLFSPADAPLADTLPLDDGAVRMALLALTTRRGPRGVQRISYADLGVEHLGGVYERLLDFRPSNGAAGGPTLVRAERRKSTGSFYTPRSLTEYLVRRTLAPLVQHLSPDQILALRVLDPAMGSGAFLVAACRYLAAAYEQALLRDDVAGPSDIGGAERAGFRRTIAQRCLFGVDINPMAVQLGRLSLWLATLANDRPLTFLDHHLRPGNSLVGATVADLLRQPPGQGAGSRLAALPLFATDGLDNALASTVGRRVAIASDPGDTLAQVRDKERALATLAQSNAPLARWKTAADLWCAGWFSAERALVSRGTFGALLDSILRNTCALPPDTAAPLLAKAAEIARRIACFHWTLEFPEVFYTIDGAALDNPGFDAVLGNPPWEMLRGDRGDVDERVRAHAEGVALTLFARCAGVYHFQGTGHANLYQLFLERALSLVRRGGRFGLVLPSGFSNDVGSEPLRRHLLDSTSIDTFAGIENRDGVFPIHRALRFLLVSGSTGAETHALPCRFGVRSPDALDAMPDTGADGGCVVIGRALIDGTGAAGCAIPELRTSDDLSVFSAVACRVPAFSGAAGWRLRFGRELNATDDRRHFAGRGSRGSPAHGLPVVEGKQVRPFAVDVDAARYQIRAATAATLLDPDASYKQPRLAYRDVASPTNRLTLIAAIVPAGVVTTHTVFCLKGEPREEVHLFLCGIFNSFVANYLVRLRVGTHVTTSIVDWLPVPKPALDSAEFLEVVRHARRLATDPGDVAAYAALQAVCARLYGLTAAQFDHVLRSFPLVPHDERDSSIRAFTGR